MASCEVCGWLSAFVSMLSFGSFGVPIKSKAAVSVDIDPLVFQSYKTIMCFLTCWLILLAGVPFAFTPWGIVSGAFWVPGGVATVYAIKNAGLAIGMGVGSSVIVLVSFIWGIFVFREDVHSKVGACLAILFMMAGLLGMAYFSSPESKTHYHNSDNNVQSISSLYEELADVANLPDRETQIVATTEHGLTYSQPSMSFGDATSSTTQLEEDNLDDEQEEEDQPIVPPRLVHNESNTPYVVFGNGRCRISKRNLGLLGTVMITGIWGGSIMVPMKWCDSKLKGANYLISFAIGASIVTIFLWMLRLFYNACHYRSILKAYEMLPSFHFRVMWLPGAISGCLWSLGNFFSILSVYYLGEGVGYPLAQTAILVSGMWGIFYFKEITGLRRVSLWMCSSSFTIFGILLLSYEHVAKR